MTLASDGYVILVLLMLATTWRGEAGQYEEVYKAVVDMYQPNDTLESNMYTVMSILCPESVFCACAGDKYDECRESKMKSNMIESDQVVLSFRDIGGCCLPCSCEPDCYENQNCCWEMPRRPDHRGKMQCIRAVNKQDNNVRYSSSQSYLMITDCFSSGYSSEIATLCRNPAKNNVTHVLPVSSRTTGQIYRNEYCSACNNDTDIEQWQLLVQSVYLQHRSQIKFPLSYEEALSMNHRAIVYFLPPDNFTETTKKWCVPEYGLRTECRKRNIHQNYPNYDFVESACSMKIPEYTITSLYGQTPYYRNVFCMFCSLQSAPKFFSSRCEESTARTASGYLILLKLRSKHKLIEESDTKCLCTEWYDEEKVWAC